MDMHKVKLAHSPLTNTIFLYRHGKDAALALDKREAEADVLSALIDHMMYGYPNGSEKIVTLGGRMYTIRVTPEFRGAARLNRAASSGMTG